MQHQDTFKRQHRSMALFTVLVLIVSLVLSVLSSAVRPASAAAPVWRVDAQGNLTKDGVIFRVKGGSWFGLQGRFEPCNDPANPCGAPMEQYIGNVFWAPSGRTYAQDATEIKNMGINVVRLPLSHQTLDATDPQGKDFLKNDPAVRIANSRLALETVIKELDKVGVYVLLDIHSCSNYVDWRKGRLDARPPYVDATRDNYAFTREESSCAATNNPATVTRIQAYNESLWLADLKVLAGMNAALGTSNIMGIDIFNEPWDYTWTEWKTLTEHAYAAINGVNTNLLVFMQGISATAGNQDGSPTTITQSPHGPSGIDPNWGENLFEGASNPPAIPKERLVYSPHAYGPSVFVGKQFMDPAQPQCAGLEGDAAGDAKCNIVINPARLAQGWDEHFGFLKALGYAVVIGEFGGNWDWPHGAASMRDQNRFGYLPTNTVDAQWQTAFVDYLIARGITDSIYWSINPESGDTGGLYTTPYRAGSNESGWGTWGALDSRKMSLLNKLWTAPGGGCGTTCPPTATTGTNPPTATRTRTATTGGTNPTATRTNTTGTNPPTATTGTQPGGLKVQYKAAETLGTANQIKPHMQIVNTGTTSVNMSDLKARYYYTKEGTQTEQYYCDYAVKGCGNVTGSFASITAVSGADRYLEIGFTTGAGSLAAGQSSGEIQNRAAKSDFSNYTQTGDYSFDATKTAFADWTKVTLYRAGTLVWGTAPGGTPPPTATTGTNPPTATRTNTTGTNPTATRTRTATTGGTNPTATRTRTATTGTNPPTATRTATSGSTGGTCSPATAITAPFTKDGSGTFCWQISTVPSYINSWNTTSVSINGVNYTNLYVAAGSLPAKINGFYYISYNSSLSYGHLEVR